jgi:hypothetical protein
MALAWSRYIAVLFAIGLGIGEAVINWGRWQYAPLWIVDYVIVAWLLWAFVSTRAGQRIHLLLAAWAFTSGVFYMALFISLDPQLGLTLSPVLLSLIGVMLAASVAGFLFALPTIHAQQGAAPDGRMNVGGRG